jgi:hypothetical protein
VPKHAGMGSPSKGELISHCTHWLYQLCPGVPKGAPIQEWNAALEKLPRTDTKYSREGTLAHKLLDLRLKKLIGAAPAASEIQKLTVKLTTKSLKNVETVLESIEKIYHQRSPCVLLSETRAKCTDIIWGTVDTVIYNRRGELDVIDFKNGSGVGVDAIDNIQGADYLGGFISRMPVPITDMSFWIIQPSHPDGRKAIQRWQVRPYEVFDRIRDHEIALENLPSEPNVGPHCDRHFCPAKCSAYQEAKAKHEKLNRDPKVAISEFLGAINEQRNYYR